MRFFCVYDLYTEKNSYSPERERDAVGKCLGNLTYGKKAVYLIERLTLF